MAHRKPLPFLASDGATASRIEFLEPRVASHICGNKRTRGRWPGLAKQTATKAVKVNLSSSVFVTLVLHSMQRSPPYRLRDVKSGCYACILAPVIN
jgi:hypothetical protein